MSKITDAIAKSRQRVVIHPTGREKTDGQKGRDRSESRKARPVLEVTPANFETDTNHLYKNRVLCAESRQEEISAYKMLRTRFLHVMRPNGWQVIAVTSPMPEDGKTLTALNLAIMLAREGSRNVFLVDLDLRNPSVYRHLGIDYDDRSIASVYSDGRDLSEMLVTIGIDGLFILGNNGPSIENSSELLSSEHTEELVAALKSLDPGGLFIIDMPPLLPSDDVLAFSPLLDAALVVVSEGKTGRDSLAKACSLLSDSETELAGLVLNRSSEANVQAYY